jgi:hypothetical protein
MESVGVKSYGIGITTLEEVFLKLGSREDELDPEDKPVLKKGMKTPKIFRIVIISNNGRSKRRPH